MPAVGSDTVSCWRKCKKSGGDCGVLSSLESTVRGIPNLGFSVLVLCTGTFSRAQCQCQLTWEWRSEFLIAAPLV